jgi:hypothetical protein
MQIAQLLVSILGFGGAIAALVFGLLQYRRSEQWKRGEFVAKEIKEFESNPEVRNTMFMIDWGIRKINLSLLPNASERDLIRVTRETQWRALVPHPLKPKYEDLSAAWDDESRDPTKPRFTATEATIRDNYDAFLSYLERFANYVRSGLVTAEEFKPYLIYWIDSIANVEGVADYEGDAEWRCALLTFINYYDYKGVVLLFNLYDRNIEPGGSIYQKLADLIENKHFYADLVRILTEKNQR